LGHEVEARPAETAHRRIRHGHGGGHGGRRCRLLLVVLVVRLLRVLVVVRLVVVQLLLLLLDVMLLCLQVVRHAVVSNADVLLLLHVAVRLLLLVQRVLLVEHVLLLNMVRVLHMVDSRLLRMHMRIPLGLSMCLGVRAGLGDKLVLLLTLGTDAAVLVAELLAKLVRALLAGGAG
jgi:hypothetical protein